MQSIQHVGIHIKIIRSSLMRHMTSCNQILMWFAFLILITRSGKSQETKAPSIDNLIESHLPACGCFFGSPSDRSSTVFEVDDVDSIAWLNIDGADIKLRLEKSTYPQKEFVAGEKFSDVYSSKLYRVEVQYVVTRLRTNEDSEWTKMDATIVVTRGKLKSRFHVSGGCGC
jgi:hypothetical protein